MSKCAMCGQDVPDEPLLWLLVHCRTQQKAMATRAANVAQAVREGAHGSALAVDVKLARWRDAAEALENVIREKGRP